MVTTLIVDDSLQFRQAFRRALRAYFPMMRIEEASDGRQTLEIIRDCHSDLVFMDIDLPQESGLELTRKIKQLCPEINIIIVTEYPAPELHEPGTR